MPIRNERRRRLVSDDSLASGSEEGDSPIRLAKAEGENSNGGATAYASAAALDQLRPIHDVVPSRLTMIGLVVVAGLVAVGAIESLHYWSDSLRWFLSAEDVLVLNLSGPRNVSHSLAALLLFASGLAAMFIYSLRRHRVDDYHGRYRIWIWTALGCLGASLVETSGMAELAHGICRRAAEACSLNDAVVWPAGTAFVLSVIALRLLIEVRRSRWTVAALLTGTGSVLLAVAAGHDLLPEVPEAVRPMVERGSCLVGYLFLLATFLLYCRHVVLEIEGVVAVKPIKPKRSKAKRKATEESEKPAGAAAPAKKQTVPAKTDLDPMEKAPAAQSSSRLQLTMGSERTAPPTTQEASRGESTGGSRAERRKLRRESRMAG